MTTVILGIVVIWFLSQYQLQIDYQRIVAEFIEQSQLKEQQSQNTYEPLTPPPGSIIQFWEQFRKGDYQPGHLPKNLNVKAGSAQMQVVIDPADEKNLVLQITSGSGQALLGPIQEWLTSGVKDTAIQVRIRVLTGYFHSEWIGGGAEFVNDGKWHTYLVTRAGNILTNYVDGEALPHGETFPPFPSSVNSLRVGFSGLIIQSNSTYLLDDFLAWENP